MARHRRILAVAVGLMLSACAVGPDYVRPKAAPAMQGYFVEPDASDPAGLHVTPGAVAGQWWKLFEDPTLDRLVADALAHNPDVRTAAANLQQARAVLGEARGARLPTTTPSAGYTRQRIGANALAGQGLAADDTASSPTHYDFGFYQLGFDASYEVDLFGRVSRSIQAARGDAEAAAADLDAARISVAAETARTYAAACSYAAQAAVARDTASLQDQTLELTRRLLISGRGTQRDLDQAAVLAENARAQAPGFEAEQRASVYALAALTGRPPAELDQGAARCAVPPRVKTAIPVGDGMSLLARRPDVRAAERRLAAETARIGVATASLYPTVTLAGSATLGATRTGDLGSARAFGFAMGPLISWNFPNIAVARARIREARASAAASLAAFDKTVLTALSETEQALARYAGALDTDAARERAAVAAEDAATLSRLRFESGRDSFLQLLDAERDRASARAAWAQSRGAVADAQVSLFKALGGGWESQR